MEETKSCCAPKEDAPAIEEEAVPAMDDKSLPLGKPIMWGVAATTFLLAVYFLILAIANSPSHAVSEFVALWYWIVAISLGFGIQAGLFSYIRIASKLRRGAATSSMAVSGGVSTTSMVACCAHHLTDILPVLGVSAAAVFLTRFQTPLMMLGVFSNTVGILLMLRIIKKSSLFDETQRFLPLLMGIDYKKAIILAIVTGVAVIGMNVYINI